MRLNKTKLAIKFVIVCIAAIGYAVMIYGFGLLAFYEKVGR